MELWPARSFEWEGVNCQIPVGEVSTDGLKIPSWTCTFCQKTLATRNYLNAHVSAYHRGRRECEICGQVFTTTSSRRKHSATQHGKAKLRCEWCSESFPSHKPLRKHYVAAHPERCFPCDDCGKLFLNRDPRNKHRRAAHRATRYKCRHCGQGFASSYLLEHHKYTENHHRASLEQLFKCKRCGHGHASKRGLLRHQKRAGHLDDSEKCVRPFECGVCHKAYTRGDGLLRHQRRAGHLPKKKKQVKDFECWACNGRVCVKEGTYESSKGQGHLPKDITLFECSVCKKSYQSLFNLRQHQIKEDHLPEEEPKGHHPENPAPHFACGVCGKPYSSLTNLRTHQAKQGHPPSQADKLTVFNVRGVSTCIQKFSSPQRPPRQEESRARRALMRPIRQMSGRTCATNWLYQLDPLTRLVGGMLVTELHGREVKCTSSELNSFPAAAWPGLRVLHAELLQRRRPRVHCRQRHLPVQLLRVQGWRRVLRAQGLQLQPSVARPRHHDRFHRQQSDPAVHRRKFSASCRSSRADVPARLAI